ncbi:MAG: hypothetical protein V1844_01380 [Pseudomonadota bacterium]
MPRLIPSNKFLKDMETFRISFDPQAYQASGNPDWTGSILLLRVLDHDDLL